MVTVVDAGAAGALTAERGERLRHPGGFGIVASSRLGVRPVGQRQRRLPPAEKGAAERRVVDESGDEAVARRDADATQRLVRRG